MATSKEMLVRVLVFSVVLYKGLERGGLQGSGPVGQGVGAEVGDVEFSRSFDLSLGYGGSKDGGGSEEEG